MRFLLALLALLAAGGALAQDHRTVPVDDPAYGWIDRLARRGLLLDLNPTAAPYTEGEIRRALESVRRRNLGRVERRWFGRLRDRFPAPPSTRREEGVVTAELRLGSVASTNDRIDPLRVVEAGEPVVGAGALNLFPTAALGASLEAGPLVAQLGARFDTYYEDDPDGLDIGNVSVFLRNEESYVGAVSRYGEVRLGRIGRRWSGAEDDALYVSDSPHPYDALAVRLGGGTVAVRSFLGELDATDAEARFTGRAGDRSREDILRRYVAAHRIDWRPSRKVVVSGMESMVISGNGTSPPFAALLPGAVYSFLNDGAPKNNDYNGFVGGLLWVQAGSVTVSGQLLMDDFDLFNAAEPASAAISGSIVAASLAPRVDAGIGLTAVTARAYNTGLREQTYVYALRGIGLPFNDYVHARAFADVYLDDIVDGLTLRPEIHLLIQGEADFREPILDNSEPLIFIGDEERTVRAGLVTRAGGTSWWWAAADLGVNWTHNDGFTRGADAVRFVGIGEVGLRIRIDAPVRLSW